MMNSIHKHIVKIIMMGIAMPALWSCSRINAKMRKQYSELISKDEREAGCSVQVKRPSVDINQKLEALRMDLELANEIGQVMCDLILLRPSVGTVSQSQFKIAEEIRKIINQLISLRLSVSAVSQDELKIVARKVGTVVAIGVIGGLGIHFMQTILPLSNLENVLSYMKAEDMHLRDLQADCINNAHRLSQDPYDYPYMPLKIHSQDELLNHCRSAQETFINDMLGAWHSLWHRAWICKTILKMVSKATSVVVGTGVGYSFGKWGIPWITRSAEPLSSNALKRIRDDTIDKFDLALELPLDEEKASKAREKLENLFIETALLTNEIQDFDNPDLMDQLEKLCHKIRVEENKVKDSMRVKTLSICAESVEAALKQLKQKSCNRNQASIV